MTDRRFDFVVVGGGIVGLATARELLRTGGGSVALLEKEPAVARHQTGHNSGVIHSGVYYRPGSLKAKLCLEGRARLIAFCDEHRIPYRIDGKIIVATRETERAALEEIGRRGGANGVLGLAPLTPEEIARHETHVRGLAGLWVPTAGVVDYRIVADALAREVVAGGGRVLLGHRVTDLRRMPSGIRLETPSGPIDAARAIVCAGLQCDRLAADLAESEGVRIVPFRGDYYALEGEARDLIRALVYPVPDGRFPFLGVHFARHIDGEVTAGPNAVLALAREGYGRFDFDARDAASTLLWPGFWRLAASHWRKGTLELWRDFVQHAYWRELVRLLPALRLQNLARGPSGVRAQAVLRDGTLVDDFLILQAGEVTHVLNAPSPAATSSFAIAREVVARAGLGSGRGTEPASTL